MSTTAHFINGPRHGDRMRIEREMPFIAVALANVDNHTVDSWNPRTASPSAMLRHGQYRRICKTANGESVYEWMGER